MKNILYIDESIKVAVIYNDILDEIINITDYENSKLKNIYRARIEKVLSNQNSAFLNIGDEKAYLELGKKDQDLKEGNEILVQVKKISDEKSKFCKVKRELSLDGRYLVYFPDKKFVKFSGKLSWADKSKLKNYAEELKIKGILFRTNSISAGKDDILNEFNRLKALGNSILKEKNLRPTPKLIFENNDLDNFIRDNNFDLIITNNENIKKEYKAEYEINYDKNFKLIYNSKLLRRYKILFDKKVELDSGGNIIIEHTSALSSIDVNSADFKSSGVSYNNYIYQLNLKAAKEIVKQIRLRNISGIIIIDFIDMRSEKNKLELLEFLSNEFKKDNFKAKVYGYTGLNLIEISRENRGRKLINKLVE
ncbi:MAG: ribonuclease E/G [Peptoniphilaceae bacterium]